MIGLLIAGWIALSIVSLLLAIAVGTNHELAKENRQLRRQVHPATRGTR